MSTNRLYIYDETTNLAVCIAKGYTSGWAMHGDMDYINQFFDLAKEPTAAISESSPTRYQLKTEDNLPKGCAVFYQDYMEATDTP